MDSIFQAEVGRKIDTGKKWIDGSVIYRKLLDVGALPNATSKNVAHGVTPSLAKFARVSKFMARNGTQYIGTGSSPAVNCAITATNLVVTTAADLTAYTQAYAEIEFCE